MSRHLRGANEVCFDGSELGTSEELPEGPGGRSQGHWERGDRRPTMLCALTEGFPGPRTFHPNPGNSPGKLGLNWSLRDREGGRATTCLATSEAAVRGLGFILHLMAVEGFTDISECLLWAWHWAGQ